VASFVEASLAPNTRRAYAASLAIFRAWCESQAVESIPATAETVAAFLAAEAKAGRKVATINQRVAAIKWAHESQNLTSPTAAKGIKSTMAGIRRKLGTAPNRKSPATVDRLAAMVAHAPKKTLKGKRDRALLLFGFASAMRRSELVALELVDLEFTDRGLLVTVRKSKSDQEGLGHQRAVPFGRRKETCPVRAVEIWLAAAGLTKGRLFRALDRHSNVHDSMSTRAVADVVKAYAQLAGLDPTQFSGHSLRAGFVTSAAERGARTERIMDHTGHKSVAMVQVYTRRTDAFEDHAGKGLL
jgi:site-specific recombinase XerD